MRKNSLIVDAMLVTASAAVIVLGIVVPEPKTIVAGVHFPAIAIALALSLLILRTQISKNALLLTAKALGFFALFLLYCVCLESFGVSRHDWLFLFNQFSTLVISGIISFVLLSQVTADRTLKLIETLFLSVALAFLVYRTSRGDFTRELGGSGYFGLGPIPFARYVGLGWVARLARPKLRIGWQDVAFASALMIADTRGVWLSVIIVAIISLLGFTGRSRVAFLSLGMIAALTMSQSQRLQFALDEIDTILDNPLVLNFSEADLEDGGVTGTVARIGAWQASVEMIKERPIWGWGAGQWTRVTGMYSLEYPHNIVLQVWSEFGIIAAGVLLLICVRLTAGVIRKSPGSMLGLYALITSFFSGSYRDARFVLSFLLLASYLGSVAISSPMDESDKPSFREK